jgi:hypothetical protein
VTQRVLVHARVRCFSSRKTEARPRVNQRFSDLVIIENDSFLLPSAQASKTFRASEFIGTGVAFCVLRLTSETNETTVVTYSAAMKH